jgi:hypothetical protein
LNKGTETNVRDGGGIAKRITCGFSQKQSGNSDRSEYHGEICLPWYHQFLKDDVRWLMGEKMIGDVGKILSLCQVYLNDLYKDQKPAPMSDSFRNSLFGDKFAESISPACTSKFEFVDIFVQSASTLHRHMDYSNGRTPGYEYGTSYSYVRMYEGREYRVNIIATCRHVCDSSIREIASKNN